LKWQTVYQALKKPLFKDIGNNKYALQSTTLGSIYIRVSGSGDGKLVNTQTYIGPWEQFYIEYLGDEEYAFRSAQWNNYLRAGSTGVLDTQTSLNSRGKFVFLPAPTCSMSPSVVPSAMPTEIPSINPSSAPSLAVSNSPSITPSEKPSATPSISPSLTPSVMPSVKPSFDPSSSPSINPSDSPSSAPSINPSSSPSSAPSVTSSEKPSTSQSPSISLALVVCDSNHNCNLEPRLVPVTSLYGARCCSETEIPNWTKYAQYNVWTETEDKSGNCQKSVTFNTAKAICEAHGARLCTMQELVDNCTILTGCDLSLELVWSSTGSTGYENPSQAPSVVPSSKPSSKPSLLPTIHPSSAESSEPSSKPSLLPTIHPSSAPTNVGSSSPSSSPSISTSPTNSCPFPFDMVNPRSGKVVNVDQEECLNGTYINIWDRLDNGGQVWCYDSATKAIINIKCNMALGIPTNANCAVSNINLKLYSRDGSTAQGFTAVGEGTAVSEGIVGQTLENVEITNEKCPHSINIELAQSTDNGTNLIVWPTHGKWNQKWTIVYLSSVPPSLAPSVAPSVPPSNA